MGGWGEFLAALAVFLASHAVPARPAIRGRLTAALGEGGYLLAYSLVSLAVLGWLVAAAGRAPYVELWPYAPWQAWVPNLAMPLVVALAALAIGAPNPLSFGGPAAGFDPARPGIAGVTRHPLPLALALWAASHAVPNGNLAHGLLFGLFAGFALLGMRILDRRRRRQLGEGEWRRLAARAPLVPFAAGIPAAMPGLWRRLGIAALAYMALLALHPAVIGMAPLPP